MGHTWLETGRAHTGARKADTDGGAVSPDGDHRRGKRGEKQRQKLLLSPWGNRRGDRAAGRGKVQGSRCQRDAGPGRHEQHLVQSPGRAAILFHSSLSISPALLTGKAEHGG